MRYLLGTGVYRVTPEWRSIWQGNKPDVYPSEEACIEVGVENWFTKPNTTFLAGNLGHVGDLLNGTKPHDFCGWSSTVMALAMIAYCNESDLIYKEQDCLAFGPWVRQMYADIGDGNMVFGRKMRSAPWMECGQSLFLIRHKFIPTFVSNYISMGKDGDLNNLPETKFAKLEETFPDQIRRLSFGYDRERPINFDDSVWYGQKFTQHELDELKRRKMI